MKFNKYAMFAVFASLLMVLSAGAVLFADQDSKADAEPQVTDKLVGIVMENNKITFKNEGNINGFTWNEKNLTLTMDGVNYKSSYEGNNVKAAFYVGKGLPNEVIIKIKNENRIESAHSVIASHCFKIESPTSIVGENNAVDKLILNTSTTTANIHLAVCITHSEAIIIDNIELDITANDSKRLSSCIRWHDKDCDAVIKNSIVNATHKESAGQEGFIVSSIENSVVRIENKTAISTSTGLSVSKNITNSMVIITTGNITDEGKYSSSMGMIIKKDTSVTVSNSIIYAKSGTAMNHKSIGIASEPGSKITFDNSNLRFIGCDYAMATRDRTTFDITEIENVEFKNISYIGGCKTVDGTDFEKITTGSVSLDNKQLKAIVSHTISYQLNGGKGTAIHPELVEFGNEVIVKECNATKEGYRFNGWTDGLNFYEPGDKIVVGFEDITLRAVWQEVPPSNYDWIIVVVMFVLLLIIGVALYRRDEDEE